MVEKVFILLPRVRRKYGILHYYRFKDDGIIVFDGKSSSDLRFEFFAAFRAFVDPFAVKVDSFSSHEFQMLDVLFWKGERFLSTSSLDSCLFTKPSSIWMPLSVESMHPVFVHRHWPLSQCKRISKRFTNQSDGEAAVCAFKNRVFPSSGVHVGEGAKSPEHSNKTITSWLVLPFHFAISHVAGAVNAVKVPTSIAAFGKVQVSWSLGNKRLMHLLRPRLQKGDRGKEG